MIANYMKNQLAQDYVSDQISLKEHMDAFVGVGERVKQGKNRQPLKVAACNCDERINPQYPFEGSARKEPSRS